VEGHSLYWRADPEDLSILDGSDDQRRAELIAERLSQWKSLTNADRTIACPQV
jgi:hypothetical protein